MKLTIHDDPEAFTQRLQSLQKLKKMNVKVGLPESAGAGLQFILAVQEHGSPIMHIPARPVIQPALSRDATRSAMASAMKDAIQAAWEGDDAAARAAMESAGQAGADGIREYIDAGISPANSPVTVSGGWIYNRAAKKSVYVSGKGFNKPLFDTGTLYDAFDYEVTEE